MADESLLARVHDLSDLELAALLCLISREHCLISTPADVLESLVLELQLVCLLNVEQKPSLTLLIGRCQDVWSYLGRC